MKKRLIATLVLALGLAGAAYPGEARAEGVMIGLSALPAGEQQRLVSEIGRAKIAHPAAFSALRKTRALVPDLDANKRGRFAIITPMLKAIGRDALYPMLEELAVSGGGRGALADTAWQAWRVALLEATGMLRDPRAAAVLEAIVDGDERDPEVLRAAVEAFARLGTDAAAAKLIAMSKVAGPKQRAILAGMGDCRRAAVARALAAAIAGKPDAATAKGIVRALGNVGSAWAWKTPVIAASGEEAATRAEAARALVRAYVAYEGEVRATASNAIMVVDDPSTPALIANAKQGASSGITAALVALEERFARNPARRP